MLTIKKLAYLALILISIGICGSCKKKATEIPTVSVDSLKVSLIAHYAFNNGGKDSSSLMNDVTQFNNVTPTADRFGNANSAFAFNGLSSYMVVPDKPALRFYNTDFTLNAWIKLNEYNTSFGSSVLSKHIVGNNNGWAWGISGFQAITKAGYVTFGPGGTSTTERGQKLVELGQWHMITSTYNYAIKEFKIYIDGELDVIVNNRLPVPNPAIDSEMFIGRDNPSASANGYFFNGALDDIRIYERLLTPSQVKRLYNHKN